MARHPPRHARPLDRHRQPTLQHHERDPTHRLHLRHRRDILGKTALHRRIRRDGRRLQPRFPHRTMAPTQRPTGEELQLDGENPQHLRLDRRHRRRMRTDSLDNLRHETISEHPRRNVMSIHRRLHRLRHLHLRRIPTPRNPLPAILHPRRLLLDQTRLHLHRSRPRHRFRHHVPPIPLEPRRRPRMDHLARVHFLRVELLHRLFTRRQDEGSRGSLRASESLGGERWHAGEDGGGGESDGRAGVYVRGHGGELSDEGEWVAARGAEFLKEERASVGKKNGMLGHTVTG